MGKAITKNGWGNPPLTNKCNTDMNNPIYIRVLQHDKNDQIRIGESFPITDLDKAEKNIIAQYEARTSWCGGFKVACERYYKRIAIVNAVNLSIMRLIYNE
jgi:hypothetical protein|nr:MAG TPA: hypothetical protein [Bacteriophage sp.]